MLRRALELLGQGQNLGGHGRKVDFSMDEDPQLRTLQKSAEIPARWEQLPGAADAGDERTPELLATFGPSAREELAQRQKS